MKKIVLAMLTALAVAGIASAQSFLGSGAQAQSVQGTLGLQNGVIVLSSGDTVYYVPHLSRHLGFIDGLKEGAHVKIDGYSMGNGYLMPSKITVGDKDYDVSGSYDVPQGGMAGCEVAHGGGHHGGYGGGKGYVHRYGRGHW
ncbi:MAG: hypothetical protein LBK61_00070 [Spirochaetaceae bacterium]|jgi:hypothetical protein|nr:hypothetical protein [Spirochaetaceae bacterium]